MENRLSKLNRILEAFDTESLSRSEFNKLAEQLFRMMAQHGEGNRQAISKIEQTYALLLDSLGKKHDELRSQLKAEVNKLFLNTQWEKMVKDHTSLMSEVRTKMATVKNGRDGRDGRRGPQGIDGRMMKPDEIVDKVNQSETLIASSQVEGLDALKKKVDLASKQESRRIFSGPNANAVQVANLTSQTDGTTKTFAIPTCRTVLMLLGKQGPFVYNPTEYTIGNRQIILTNDVEAPKTGQTLLLLYVK